MRRRLLVLLALFALVAASCSSSGPESERAIVPVLPTTTAGETGAESVDQATDDDTEVSGPEAGAVADFETPEPAESLLLVQGEVRDGEEISLSLEVRSPDGTVVTDLSELSNGQSWQPTWSNDGRWVAFAFLDADGEWLLGVSSWDGTQQNVVPLGGRPDYLVFSFDDRRVYALVGSASGFGLISVDPFTGQAPEAVTAGRPLFFDQAPSGTLAFKDADGIYVVDPVGEQRSQLLSPVTEGTFNTPRWASDPVAIFGVVEVEGAEWLSMVPVNGGPALPLAPVSGPVTIDAVVDEALVAVIVNGPPGTAPGDALGPGLHVIDLEASELRLLSGDVIGAPVISPDGLWVAGSSADADGRRTVVHRVDGSESVSTPPYVASPALLAISIDQFYDQYSMGQSPFAADSSAIAFTGTIGEQSGVFVQSLDDSEPVYAGAGDVVWWSPT